MECKYTRTSVIETDRSKVEHKVSFCFRISWQDLAMFLGGLARFLPR